MGQAGWDALGSVLVALSDAELARLAADEHSRTLLGPDLASHVLERLRATRLAQGDVGGWLDLPAELESTSNARARDEQTGDSQQTAERGILSALAAGG